MISSNYSVNPNSMPPQTNLLQMIMGYWVSQCIYIAAKLGIADLLQNGEQHSDTLASATNTNKDAMYRLLRALASIGIFAQTQPYYFKLTPLATYLQSDVPHSLKAVSIMFAEEHYQAWGNLMYSMQTGKNAFENLYGANIFEFYKQNHTSGEIFDQAMTDISVIENIAVLAAYDFSSIDKLVDVGGGNGRLLSSLIQAHSAMTGVLFDQPDVIERAFDLVEKSGISDRLQLVTGNFFETIPVGGDAYVLKHILHNWSNEQAIAILKNCYQAMVEPGRLLVIEMVIPPGNEPDPSKFLDINMLVVCPGGRERTQAEYEELFKAAGFKLTRIIPTVSDVSVIEGVKS
ncbi:MAG: methyltransferase [Symploca sp. SIO2C1]|nr:methyltransferase [Symploca sp. SIO2C1]